MISRFGENSTKTNLFEFWKLIVGKYYLLLLSLLVWVHAQIMFGWLLDSNRMTHERLIRIDKAKKTHVQLVPRCKDKSCHFSLVASAISSYDSIVDRYPTPVENHIDMEFVSHCLTLCSLEVEDVTQECHRVIEYEPPKDKIGLLSHSQNESIYHVKVFFVVCRIMNRIFNHRKYHSTWLAQLFQ